MCYLECLWMNGLEMLKDGSLFCFLLVPIISEEHLLLLWNAYSTLNIL